MTRHYLWSNNTRMFQIEFGRNIEYEYFLTMCDNLSLKHIKKNVDNDVETKIWKVINDFI